MYFFMEKKTSIQLDCIGFGKTGSEIFIMQKDTYEYDSMSRIRTPVEWDKRLVRPSNSRTAKIVKSERIWCSWI